ncbi:O51G2 protein, partial [Crocuta crocuta]
FCSIYLTVIVGNLTILHIIRTDVTLHEPMYYFLAMLALTDLGLCLSTLPTVLGIFCFDVREIAIPVCFTQLFFIHTLSLVESSVLLSMSVDRYVAICNPLRYSTVLTPARIVRMGLSSMLRNFWLFLNSFQAFGRNPIFLFPPYTMSLGLLEDSSNISSTFLLSGIPGLEHMHIWISIPLCFIYLASILGNCTILFIIKTEPSLHEPMYLFLSMLAMTDLGLSLCTLPTVLGIFWIGARDIGHDACFAQLFFIHCLSFLESSVLLSMAFDRFVAICRPLHYASILTNTVIGRIGLVSLGRSVALIFPLPFMLKRFPYCGSAVLSHSYCLHQEVMKLACADIKANSIYGMFVIVSTVGIDSLLILFSYALILRTVLSIASRAERFKALNTCVSHI